MCYQLKPRRRVFLTDWLDRLIYLWPIYHTPFPLHPPSSSPPSVSTLQLYPSLIIRRQQIIKATTNIDHALSEKSLLTFFFFCLSVCLSSEVVQTLFRGCECGHPDRYVAIGCTSQTWLQCLLEGRHAKGKMEKYIKITEKKKGLPDVWSERMPQQARQLEKAYGILSSMSF